MIIATLDNIKYRIFGIYLPQRGTVNLIGIPRNYVGPRGSKGPLAIQPMEVDYAGNITDCFAVLTVNLDPYTGMHDQSDTRAFVDTNNNSSWGCEAFISTFGLGKDTQIRRRSGYCTYPLYEFNLEKFYANDN